MVRTISKQGFEAKVRELLPEAEFAQDNDGQMIIYTNLPASDERFSEIA